MSHSVLATEDTAIDETDTVLLARGSHSSFRSRTERKRNKERKKLIQKLLKKRKS